MVLFVYVGREIVINYDRIFSCNKSDDNICKLWFYKIYIYFMYIVIKLVN